MLFFKRFVEGEEEGVGHAFGSDVRAWAVAWDDGDGAVEGDDLFEDALHDHVIISAWMVRAADGAGKEGVTAEKDFFSRFIVTYASYCVAGGIDELEAEAADLDCRNFTFFPYIDGLERRREGSTEPAAEILVVFQSVLVSRVHVDRQRSSGRIRTVCRMSIMGGQFGNAENMVEVPMCQHDACRLESLSCNEAGHLGDFRS